MFKNIFELYSRATTTLFAPVSSSNTILKAALHSEFKINGYKEIKIAPVSVKKELSSETIKAIQKDMFQDNSKSWLKHTFEVKTISIDDSASFENQDIIEHHIVIADDHVNLGKDKLSVSRYFFYNRKMPHEYDSQRFEFINAQALIEAFRFRSLVTNTIPKLTADQIFNSQEMKNLLFHLNPGKTLLNKILFMFKTKELGFIRNNIQSRREATNQSLTI